MARMKRQKVRKKIKNNDLLACIIVSVVYLTFMGSLFHAIGVI